MDTARPNPEAENFIPVVGYLDDLILLALGVMAVLALVPGPVLDECRALAARL